MKVLDVSIDRVVPYPGNPRLNEKAISRVAKSIESFGWNQPIVVDSHMVVIAGHTRLEAAKLLNLTTVPIVVAAHLSETEAKAYRLADNKTAEFSSWDESKLFAELKELSDLGALEVTGFTQSEMLALEMQAQALLDSVTAQSAPKPAPETGKNSVQLPSTPDAESIGVESNGMELQNDHDEQEPEDDGSEEDQEDAPAMVRLEVILDEYQRKDVVRILNEAKEKNGLATLGEALNIVCLEWMESRT